MSKRIKRWLKCFALIIGLFLFACSNVKVENIVETSASESEVSTEAKESESGFGEELTKLTGSVRTLSKYSLPKESEETHGFTVQAIYDYPERNAKVVLFEHNKSGAKVLLISNDDEDKAAALGFNTLTFDNKGIPHVFEHACLGGSEKYPNANLFNEAVNRTYNTYMNASTMQHATVYPFSSLSDVQLFELYKFYMDGVFNPDILREDKNLEAEAYRYTLNNKNEDITLNGVVYSEMSGVEANIGNVAYYNSLKTMFNDSFMGMTTGGETAHITEISNQELIDFHDKYYHPSNMVIMLYGDIDYKKYLKYSDEEYLCKVEKKEIEKSDPNYKVQDGFNIVKHDFPASEDAEIEGQTIIGYNVVCDGMSAYESGAFELVLSALENSDGPIKTKLLERLPNASFSIENSLFMPKPFFTLSFSNVDEKDSSVIKEIVEESFNEIIESGIKEDILEDTLNYNELEFEEEKDSHGFAKKATLFFARVFSSNGEDILGYFKHDKAIREIKNAYENGMVKELIDTYLSKNNAFSMDITTPKRGLLEEKSKKLTEELKNKKASMSDSEINELIKKTKEFDAWVLDQGKVSLIDKLRVATISELDEYRAKCYAYEENIEGIKFIRSEIDDIKYNRFDILFNISNLNSEDAMKLNFLSSLLLELPTTNYPGQKLKAEFGKYTSYSSAAIYVNQYYNGGYVPYFCFSYKLLDKNLDKVFELMKELMYETKFEDVEIVRNEASISLNNIKNYASVEPSDLADEIVNVKINNDSLYEFNLNGVKYIDFLKKVSQMSDAEIRELLKECEKIYEKIYNSSGLVCNVIGNFETVKSIKSKVLDLSKDFKREKIVFNEDIATVSELKNKTAIVSTGTMQYNYIVTPMLRDDIDYTAKYVVLGRIIDDKILYPEFRVKRSSYGAYTSFSRFGSCAYTYRDPNLKETYSVFNDLPKLIKGLKLTEEELDDYKLKAYAAFAYPLTKVGAATVAITEVLNKTDEKRPDRYVRYMREIKDMKISDIKELSSIFDKMINDGIYVTVGGKEEIEKNKDMFDEIIYDYVK